MKQSNSVPSQIELLCAKEKIHTPGCIQPHGVLIAVREDTLSIVQASESVLTIFGMAHEDLIGQPIKTLIGSEQQAELRRQVLAKTIFSQPLQLTFGRKTGPAEFEAVIHRSDGLLILEFEERASLAPAEVLEFFRTSNQAISQLMTCTSQHQLFQSAAEFVRRLTGFDRILIYLFDPEWNGTVLAECKAAEMKSYLGLKFPASDIPEQARELYKRNSLRLLANVEAEPSPISPSNNPLTAAPLDLSESILRAISPVHIEYLKNMGVSASMSLSLISDGELRGLIACHHSSEKYVDHRVRQACDVLARLVTLQMDAIQEREVFKRRELLKDARKDLLLHIAGQDDLPSAIASAGTILKVAGAEGAAVVWNERCCLVGTTPDQRQIADLLAHLSNTGLPVFVTDSASTCIPGAKSMAVYASGLLALRLATCGSKWLLWFRPQQLEELSWAGKEEKFVTRDDGIRLHPRKSFEIWKEIVSGKSSSWSSCEVQSALELRADILSIVVSMSEKKHAADLERQVKQLNSLSQQLLVARDAAIEASRRKSEMISVVSHDLRAPLTSIKGSLALLNGSLHNTEPDWAELVNMAYTNCNYLLNLIGDLLNLESIESGSLTLQYGDMTASQLIDEAFQIVRASADAKSIALVAEAEALTVFADKDRLLQVMVNLISNAIKFSPANSRVLVTAQSCPEGITIKVVDQGRGIPANFRQLIFQRFRQVEAADRHEKGGAGLGLAICKSLVEAHGGTIGVQSNLDRGSTFWLCLPPGDRPCRQVSFDAMTNDEVGSLTTSERKNSHLPMFGVCKILIIEDNYDHFELLCRSLHIYKEAGLTIEHSDCLAAALGRLRSGSFDMVILDLSLPDSQGVGGVRKVHLTAPSTPIIVLSGADDIHTAMESLQHGADDYLLKDSVDTASLGRSLNYALARHSAQEANERLATIAEASEDAIIGKTLNGIITSWSKGATKLFGYSAEEATGKSISMIIPPEASNELSVILKTVGDGQTVHNLETVRVKKNGERINILATISPIVREDGTIFGAAAIDRDITELKRAQQDIADARLRLSMAVDAAAIGVWDFDLIKNVFWRSQRHDEIFGHRELLPDWNLSVFTTYVVPDDLTLVKEAFELGLQHGQFALQCRIIRAHDQSLRWISWQGQSFRNEQGVAVRMMGTVTDITDIRQREEQERLLASMKEREEFMATLTHDLKDPLIGANRLLELFLDGSLGETSPQQAAMHRTILESNLRLLKLIADLIEVHRFEKDVNILVMTDCDLVGTVETCLRRVVPFANLRSVALTRQFPKEMAVRVDISKLERVVQNLLDNALKFAPDGGAIKVRLFTQCANSIIEIEDNGPGILPEEQERLFKRFSQGAAGRRYTSGSGLGLYLCKQIVEAHGGTIECKSQPNIATIFRVCLPAGSNEKTEKPTL